MDIEQFAKDLRQETLSEVALAEEDRNSPLEVFTRQVAERLEEAGEFEDATVVYHKARGVEVSGYAFGDDETKLSLFVTDLRESTSIESLSEKRIERLLERVAEFARKSLAGYAETLDESTREFELAHLIRNSEARLETITLYLFSDARSRKPKSPKISIGRVKVRCQVWDLERLYRLDSSGVEHEPITINVVQRTGAPIACIRGPIYPDHTVFILVLSGALVASLYDEFGSRLLERNVRSFLQAQGGVNRGIRDTIRAEPQRFLAYNNGISATASSASVVVMRDGGLGISEISDLQIVNGGQTTASLFAAMRRDKADLADVNLQCKLTVVKSDAVDELVSHISKYSNTQNKVTAADFSANHPFHVAVERISMVTWAPSPDGTRLQTHWFYERARGHYRDEIFRAGSPAAQRQFKVMNPPEQKFTKTDLAKFEHSWEQLPHIVSRGAEKNFTEFMSRLVQRSIIPDASYFERLVAKAILFRRTERIVSAQKFGGYRANVVTYTIAKLSNATASRLDLQAIWKRQEISEATATAIEELSHLAWGVIMKPEGAVRNYSEWCKRPACWAAMSEAEWDVPSDLSSELIDLHVSERVRIDSAQSIDRPEERQNIDRTIAQGAELWFRLSNWAKETNNLQPWQRGLAYSMGKVVGSSREPTVKQARQAVIILEEAGRLGFV